MSDPRGRRRLPCSGGCGRRVYSAVEAPKCSECRKRDRCGTVNGYRKGCRCDACRAMNTAAGRAYRARKRAEGVDVTAQYRRLVPKVCSSCGEGFEGRPGQKFCSRACIPAAVQKKASGECRVCGLSFVGAVDRVYCSRRCRGRVAAGYSVSSALEVWGPPLRLPERRPGVVRWWSVVVQGACAHCGEGFTAASGSVDSASLPRFCSERCSRRHGNAERRARKRDAFVEPVFRRRVFERDGWVCQICMERVDRRCKVPHPRSAVLDHIVPLAQGGTHEPRNVQCAHFLCNSLKSDRAANDQLRLIG